MTVAQEEVGGCLREGFGEESSSRLIQFIGSIQFFVAADLSLIFSLTLVQLSLSGTCLKAPASQNQHGPSHTLNLSGFSLY
jgi:hypothetical protein